MKKFLSLLLAAALCACMLAAAGCNRSRDKDAAEVTLVISVPVNFTLNTVASEDIKYGADFVKAAGAAFAEQYGDAKVTVNVREFAYVNEVEAITGSFGKSNAPDVLFEGFLNMSSYIYSGHVAPLDDVITDEMRADIDANYLDQGKADGKQYMLPFYGTQNVLAFNKSLFDYCGLGKYCDKGTTIQNWTLDEWESILDTLAQKLPEKNNYAASHFPMMMYAKDNQGDTHIMSFIRAFGSEIFDENDYFNFSDEKAVQALRWIRDGVDRGWYMPYPQNLGMSDDCGKKFKAGELAFYNFSNGSSLYKPANIEKYGYVNYPGGVSTFSATGFEVFDNGSAEKMKAAKAFVKFVYENEKWLDISAGAIPVSKKVSEKYADKILMLSDFAANSGYIKDFMHGNPNWQGSDNSVRSVFYKSIQKLLAGKLTAEQCAAELDLNCNAAIRYGRENGSLHG